MKKIKLEDTDPYNGKTPKDNMIALWEKNFLREAGKFISSTYLKKEDLGTEFLDSSGEKWKILGYVGGKELPCEKVSTGEIFIWDRWDVSMIVRSEEHQKGSKVVEYIYPEKKKTSRKKSANEKSSSQLDLFSESEE